MTSLHPQQESCRPAKWRFDTKKMMTLVELQIDISGSENPYNLRAIKWSFILPREISSLEPKKKSYLDPQIDIFKTQKKSIFMHENDILRPTKLQLST